VATGGSPADRHPSAGNRIGRLVGNSEALLAKVRQNAEILAAVEKLGYAGDVLARMQESLRQLGDSDLEQKTAKGNKVLAENALRVARQGFVRHYLPLRQRIRVALRSEPELRKKLGQAA
jgi:hypothetical protein